jgi:hypothetical protein
MAKGFFFIANPPVLYSLTAVPLMQAGGEGGIRTHAPLARRPLFESGTINHSDTSPSFEF